MPRFELRQSAKLDPTSYSGLALIGQCLEAAQVEAVIDPKLPVSQGMKTSDLVKSLEGLLTLGKRENAVLAQANLDAAEVNRSGRSHYEALEAFRQDRFFKQALQVTKVPSSAWAANGSMTRPRGCES